MSELRIPRYAAVGILECLWHWTTQYAISGDIGRYSDDLIASAVDWKGDPSALCASLVRVGWVDEHPRFRLVIHGWSEHADDATQIALARKCGYFWDGTQPKMTRLNASERESIIGRYKPFQDQPLISETHGVRTEYALPCPALPIPSLPSPSHPSTPPSAAVSVVSQKPSDEKSFAAFWSAYPKTRRSGKPKCERIWTKQKLGEIADQVLSALEQWKASELWSKDGGKFVMGPQRWLNERNWETPPKTPGGEVEDEEMLREMGVVPDKYLDDDELKSLYEDIDRMKKSEGQVNG